jgi:hypothetical protein
MLHLIHVSNDHSLIAFDNIDKLPPELGVQLETRVVDLMQSNKALQVMTTSTSKFRFNYFCSK